MSAPIRLSDFILAHMDNILAEWEQFASTIVPAALTMDSEALRDHAALMLKTIAKDLATPQTENEQLAKSQAQGPRERGKTAAETHAEDRLRSGFTIEQLFSEYRALRASVLQLWTGSAVHDLRTAAEDMTRFNEAIDQAIAESLARYAALVKSSQNLFLAILGHDLRNPLATTIMASSFLMRSEDVGAKCTLAATRIYNSSQRMNKLINDLIDYTRTHLGRKLPVHVRKTNLAKIVTDVVEEGRIAHPSRAIQLKVDGAFDGAWDEDRIAQVFSNILGNAIQHGSADPIEVKLTSSRDEVTATVCNHGKPIPRERLEQIFDPLIRFAEDDSVDYAHETSLGIGLYISREIVTAHAGSIDVTSSAQDGTVFKITLPRESKPVTVE